MAKAQKIVRPDEPNIIFPLATSYNERGIAGYTHSVTNSEDQRKVNCFYELAKNPMTGKGTLTLAKRPGVSDSSGGATFGTATQQVFLIISQPISTLIGKQVGSIPPWVISIISGTDIRASDAATDTVIQTIGATYRPSYIDKTLISGVETVVLQLRPFTFSSVQRVYYSNAIATWTEITDADFTALVHRGKMEHMDGFAFILEAQNRIFNSDTNSISSWVASNFITKQIVQDTPVGLAKLNNQIIAFGEDTVEMFYNAGNATGSPLLPIRHLHQRIGLVAPRVDGDGGHYYCTIGDRIYFVGRAAGGIKTAGVFAYNGSVMEKISTPYIDKILSELASSTTAFSSVNSMGFHGKMAVSILLTVPNDTAPRWLMFFPEWKEWFEWTSTIFNSINSGEHFLACSSGNKATIYNFPSTDNWQDAGTSYQWFSQFKLPTNGSARRFMHMYGVDADTDASANDLTVEISTNDCVSFSTLGTIDQTQDRKLAFRGGAFRKAHIRLGNTNARPTRIHNFLARID